MSMFEGSLNQEDLLQITGWSETLFRCKDVRTFNSIYNTSHLNGDFVITLTYRNTKPWYLCFDGIEFLENVVRYLRLNIKFVQPNGQYDRTLKMIANNQIDYIIDGVQANETYLRQNPNLTIIATQGYHKLNFLLRKETIKFSVVNYLNVFNSPIWLLAFMSMFFISGIISFIQSRQYHQKKKLWNINLNLIFDYLNMLMSKISSPLLNKLTTCHFLMYFIPILSILFTNVITCEFYSNLVSSSKQWFQTLDCFAKSNIKFFNAWGEYFHIRKIAEETNEWQFKAIIPRLERQKGAFQLSKYVDFAFGKNVLITNSNNAKIILYYKEFVDKEIQNHLINALEMDYKFDMYIMNTNHVKYKQIAKFMHSSLYDYGITMKTDRLGKHGWLLYYYLFEKFAHPNMVNKFKKAMHTKHNQTTFEEIFGVIILLLFMLSICVFILIMEISYFACTQKFLHRDRNKHSKSLKILLELTRRSI